MGVGLLKTPFGAPTVPSRLENCSHHPGWNLAFEESKIALESVDLGSGRSVQLPSVKFLTDSVVRVVAFLPVDRLGDGSL